MTDDAEPPASKPAKPALTEREARLAQALRANLRRRKAAAAGSDENDGNGSSS